MALPGVHQHSEGPVVFGARHAAATMLAGDQTAVPVTGVAIGKVGRLLKHTDRAGGFFPFEDAVVGNIAPQQVAPIAKPDRAFDQRHPVYRRSTAASLSQYCSKRGSSAVMAGSG